MLKQRVITALVLLAVIIGVLALGGTTAWGVLMLPVMALAMTAMLLLVMGAQSLCLRGMSAHDG